MEHRAGGGVLGCGVEHRAGGGVLGCGVEHRAGGGVLGWVWTIGLGVEC